MVSMSGKINMTWVAQSSSNCSLKNEIIRGGLAYSLNYIIYADFIDLPIAIADHEFNVNFGMPPTSHHLCH